jgi:Leucine-rich repeat (LRR) protein
MRITEIDLSSNGLKGLPPSVASMAGLRVLRAKYNRLSRLPLEVLAQLHRCEQLDLEGNQITAVE